MRKNLFGGHVQRFGGHVQQGKPLRVHIRVCFCAQTLCGQSLPDEPPRVSSSDAIKAGHLRRLLIPPPPPLTPPLPPPLTPPLPSPLFCPRGSRPRRDPLRNRRRRRHLCGGYLRCHRRGRRRLGRSRRAIGSAPNETRLRRSSGLGGVSGGGSLPARRGGPKHRLRLVQRRHIVEFTRGPRASLGCFRTAQWGGVGWGGGEKWRVRDMGNMRCLIRGQGGGCAACLARSEHRNRAWSEWGNTWASVGQLGEDVFWLFWGGGYEACLAPLRAASPTLSSCGGAPS